MVTSSVSSPTGTTNDARFLALNGEAATPTTANDSATADRFLKLLVTQLQNQDPLNPLDNAQITSQMAQINTVNGIQTLNTTVEGLNSQFVQLQALTGASLVGHDVTVKGNQITLSKGSGVAGFELGSTADGVKVEVLNAAGHVVDTLNLGVQPAGRHSFNWNPENLADGDGYRFRVLATKGTAAVESTALMRDRVQAVHSSSTDLVLETQHNGPITYSDVKGFN
jgi:flagellar basal-body rod modification protein FlgD